MVFMMTLPTVRETQGRERGSLKVLAVKVVHLAHRGGTDKLRPFFLQSKAEPGQRPGAWLRGRSRNLCNTAVEAKIFCITTMEASCYEKVKENRT
jgi:hypothetical protein